jgi:hypothetical protein
MRESATTIKAPGDDARASGAQMDNALLSRHD